MIVFINGAFGVGKSTTAELLAARLPNSLLFDAEMVGYFLRRVIPASEQPDDFQNLPMWRTLTVATAHQLRQNYGWTLIMPMAIWHQPYFDEILGGLRAAGNDIHHFCLTATASILEARIRASNEAVEWRLAHAERCITAFQTPTFATQVPTDGKTPEEVVEEILAQLPRERTASTTDASVWFVAFTSATIVPVTQDMPGTRGGHGGTDDQRPGRSGTPAQDELRGVPGAAGRRATDGVG